MSDLFYYISLHTRVLIVACINTAVGDWAAYIGPVAGQDHAAEYKTVADIGSKADFEVAKLYFPKVAAKYTWRT